MNRLAQTEQPYEKFLKYGPEVLSDAELLAIIIRTGTKDDNATALGEQILNLDGNCWGLSVIHHFSIKDFKNIKGIGEVKAIKLKCIGEIAKRIAAESARKGLTFTSPKKVAAFYMEQMRHLEKERTVLVMLDNKNRFLCDEIISEGTVNSTLISPREVLLRALQERAVNIMLLHNHPSGDASPSRQDCIMTNRIKEAADLIDIHLIDHIVIGDRQYTSFKEKGLL